LLTIDIGTYYPTKGLSNSEIASLSRSEHQSQGFGSTGSRGSQLEYLEFIEGEYPKNKQVFDGIDTSWNRVKGGSEIGKLITEIEKKYDFNNPSASIPQLLKVYQLIQNLDDKHWKSIKILEIKNIIAACSGLYLEAVANSASTTAGSENTFKIEAINRSNFPVALKSLVVNPMQIVENKSLKLDDNEVQNFSISATIPSNINQTSPYWLNEKRSLGMYQVSNTNLIGLPETPRAVSIIFNLDFNGVLIPFSKDVVYKYNDPVNGEVYQPFEILPEVSASFIENVYIFPNNEAQKITVVVKGSKENLIGKVELCGPKDWVFSPSSYDFNLTQKGEIQRFDFELFPPENQSEGLISPLVTIGNKTYTNTLIEIDYGYIPFQSVVMPSEAKVVRLNIEKKGQIIGYIQGAGDVIPTSLRQIGYTVVELNEDEITPEKLANFDAVIVGIRAYNTNDKSAYYQKYLHNYVENGGTLLVQYNTNHQLKVSDVAPYPVKLSRDRVTDENSEVRIINPTHKLLNYPNKITQSDFDGWVQERGLYFPSDWDANYETIISMNDKGESPKDGSILVAKYGKGNFIYTGLSLFRELPAGVPGAYKLIANMLSIGKEKNEKTLKN
jgi:hypothetical protein